MRLVQTLQIFYFMIWVHMNAFKEQFFRGVGYSCYDCLPKWHQNERKSSNKLFVTFIPELNLLFNPPPPPPWRPELDYGECTFRLLTLQMNTTENVSGSHATRREEHVLWEAVNSSIRIQPGLAEERNLPVQVFITALSPSTELGLGVERLLYQSSLLQRHLPCSMNTLIICML